MKTMRTALTLASAFGLGFAAFAQSPQRDLFRRDTATGTGKFEARRGGGDVSKAFCELGADGRATVEITTRGDKRTFRPRWESTGRDTARLIFDDRDQSGDGTVEFRAGKLVRVDLSGRGNDGRFALSFRCNDRDRDRDWDRDRDRDSDWGRDRPVPGWQNNDDYDNDWTTNRDNRRNRWENGNSIVREWTGTSSGNGNLWREGRRDQDIRRVRIILQRDGDIFITLYANEPEVFRGVARREGDRLVVDLRTAFSDRVERGTATITLNRRYKEFDRITLRGSTRGGRPFEARFDALNY